MPGPRASLWPRPSRQAIAQNGQHIRVLAAVPVIGADLSSIQMNVQLQLRWIIDRFSDFFFLKEIHADCAQDANKQL